MSINKSIFYQLCKKGIMVNLYKLLFLSSHFSFQPNKRVFHPLTFPSLQPNTHEGKLNIFHPPTFPFFHNFPPFHFSTPPTKRTLKELKAGFVLIQSFVCLLSSIATTTTPNPPNTKQSLCSTANFLDLNLSASFASFVLVVGGVFVVMGCLLVGVDVWQWL